MTPEKQVKLCKTCLIEKSIVEFGLYKNVAGKEYRRAKCKPCRVKEVSSVYRSRPEIQSRTKEIGKKYHFLRRYNITQEQLQELKQVQNNQCKICGQYKEKLHLDHCHKTGRIRGLLCFKCNAAIGMFNEDINVIRNAINYLKENKNG